MDTRNKLLGLAVTGFIVSGVPGIGVAQTRVDFSGFGTLGATYNSSRMADYRGSIVQPNGAGSSKAWATGVDTKAGVQLAARMDDGWSGVLQVVADHRHDNSYKPQLEWANLKYQFTPNWYVRAGRVVAPVFMVSDYRSVGYAQTAVRPSYDVYELNPLTHLDGGDIGARYAVAGGTLNAQLTVGRAKEFSAITTPELKAPGNYAYISGPTGLVNLSYEHGASTYRAGYGRYKLGVTSNIGILNMYDNALRNYQRVDPGYDSNLKMQRDVAKLWSLGYAYDDGRWLLQSEFARSSARNILIPDQSAWYLLGAYRLGKFTPYASYSRIEARPRPLNRPDASRCGSDAMCSLGAAAIIPTIDTRLSVMREQNTLAAGMRYDFQRNLAFKLQLEHIRKPAMNLPNRGLFVNEYRESATFPYSTWLTQHRSVNLLSLTLDFVF